MALFLGKVVELSMKLCRCIASAASQIRDNQSTGVMTGPEDFAFDSLSGPKVRGFVGASSLRRHMDLGMGFSTPRFTSGLGLELGTSVLWHVN